MTTLDVTRIDAQEAARLVAVLRPAVALPHHFAFTSGRLGDRMITRGDNDPRHFADAAARLAPTPPSGCRFQGSGCASHNQASVSRSCPRPGRGCPHRLPHRRWWCSVWP